MYDVRQNQTDALLYELVYNIGCTYISDLRLQKKEAALRLLEQKRKFFTETYGTAAFQNVLTYVTG